MNEKSSYIRVGFYENFKGFDSVLFSVDLEGLIEIEKVFLQLSESINDFDFKNLKLIDKDFCIDIKAFVDKENLGLKQIDFRKYEWRVTSKVWSIFRQQLTGA
jgi:hypothetical protein